MERVPTPMDACFPRAPLYRGVPPAGASVHEPPARFRAFPYSERHLQCVWSDASLRPATLRTHRGEEVHVEAAGVWNLEAGPDFLGAALRIGPERRRVTGDVEIHIHPSDWQQHGHRSDPRYDRVVAHVTYFHAPLPEQFLPPGCVQIALREPLATNPIFSFDAIDTTSYPYSARAAMPPCSVELAAWSPDQRLALLDAAGEERLRRKAARMADAIAERGPEQVCYEEVMAALGYKHNKAAFRRLAEVVTLADVRRVAAGSNVTAYALLAGVAGLLPSTVQPAWDEETRVYVRSLWDAWWRYKGEWESRCLQRSAWRLSGFRPANHPLRRLAAAASLFVANEPLAWMDQGLPAFHAGLLRASDAYWSFRESLAGKKSERPVQLVGEERADAITVNVAAPFLAAAGRGDRLLHGMLDTIPVEGDNAVLKQTAHHLFGPDHPAKLYATGLRRQGLVQIFHDYCLNDRSRCASCVFPALLHTFRTRQGS